MRKIKHIVTSLFPPYAGRARVGLFLLLLLLASCSDNPALEQDDDRMQLTLDVVETGWHGETLGVSTRSGETLEGLKVVSDPPADGQGFGIYCGELNYNNTQVTWDHTNSRWNIGEKNYHEYWSSTKSGDLHVYAYAPFKSGGYTKSENKITFVAQKHGYPGYLDILSGDNVDLLQASVTHAFKSNKPAILEFKHKLAKLTFGTLTNNTGEEITLDGFKITGTLNTEAKLDLATGLWSDHSSSETDIKLPPPFVNVFHNQAGFIAGAAPKILITPIADGQTVVPNMPSNSLLMIPNANGKITVTIEVLNSTGETFSFPITLEEGKEKIVNITIGRNFEVVIE